MSIADSISEDLRIPRTALHRLEINNDAHYRQFIVNGRIIEAPDNELKLIQTWISDFVRTATPELPKYVTAYEPGSSILINASAHAERAHILSLDVRHFFHSWMTEEIKKLFKGLDYADLFTGKNAVVTDEDAALLAKLSTRRGHLTMGSPSSPAIANRLMKSIDEEICSSLPQDYSYTRYSDDITISSDEAICISDIVELVSDALSKKGLELNKRKIHCGGKGDNRRVTGVFINPEGSLSIGKNRRKRIKALVFKYVVSEEVERPDARKVLGHLNFCRQIEPDFAYRLISKYSNYGRAVEEPGGLMGLLEREARNQL